MDVLPPARAAGTPTAPPLSPFPPLKPGFRSPAALWQEYHALPKAPLIVTLRPALPLPSPANLDALLATAVLQTEASRWHLNDRREPAWVLPLPLALVDVVQVQRDPDARLPVWATSPLMPEGDVLEAVCLGHLPTVQGLLRHVRQVGHVPVSTWTVRAATIEVNVALEAILETRPRPAARGHSWGGFTPPYWHRPWHQPLA